jgi:hypothetical protein
MVISGLTSCAGGPDHLQGYATYAQYGAAYLGHIGKSHATECGYTADSPGFADLFANNEVPGSCEHSVTEFFSILHQACPEQCKDGGDDLGDGERYCEEGERARTPEFCGPASPNAGCGPALTAWVENDMASIKSGFERCATGADHLRHFAHYGQYGADWMHKVSKDMAIQCGYTADTLPTVFANRADPGTCAHGIYNLMPVLSNCREQCKERDRRDGETGENTPTESDECVSVPAGAVAPADGTFTSSVRNTINVEEGDVAPEDGVYCGHGHGFSLSGLSGGSGGSGLSHTEEDIHNGDEELEHGERWCDEDEDSRTPGVCGADVAPECGEALSTLAATDFDVLGAGMNACLEDTASPYFEIAQHFTDTVLIKGMILDFQRSCGYNTSDNIFAADLASEPGTCPHAFAMFTQVRGFCPESCDEDLESCTPDLQYTSDACGPAVAPLCTRAVLTAENSDLELFAQGLKACNSPHVPSISVSELTKKIADIKTGCAITPTAEPTSMPTSGAPTAQPTADPTASATESGSLGSGSSGSSKSTSSGELTAAVQKSVSFTFTGNLADMSDDEKQLAKDNAVEAFLEASEKISRNDIDRVEITSGTPSLRREANSATIIIKIYLKDSVTDEEFSTTAASIQSLAFEVVIAGKASTVTAKGTVEGLAPASTPVAAPTDAPVAAPTTGSGPADPDAATSTGTRAAASLALAAVVAGANLAMA